jgi:hypothetical protein
MADTAIAITAGTGTNVDTRTESTNGNHRQVVVIGDPATNAGVAPVDATNGLAVDVKASALPTGAATAAKQPALGTAGNASTDVITVQGIASGTALAVSGTVTAELSATDNAVLDAIATDTGTIAGDIASIDGKLPALGQALAAASVPVVLTADQITTLTPPAAITGFATSAKQDTLIGHVDGIEGLLTTMDADTSALAGAVAGTEVQVDIVGALPAGTNAIGKLAANSGVDIGDVDVTSLPALPAGTNTIGNVGHGKTIKTVTGTVSADTDIVTAVSSKRIKVIAYSLITGATTANVITFQSDATTALWTVPLQAITGTVAGANLAIPAPSFLFATAAGEKLTLDVSAAQSVTYSVTYFDDDAS